MPFEIIVDEPLIADVTELPSIIIVDKYPLTGMIIAFLDPKNYKLLDKALYPFNRSDVITFLNEADKYCFYNDKEFVLIDPSGDKSGFFCVVEDEGDNKLFKAVRMVKPELRSTDEAVGVTLSH